MNVKNLATLFATLATAPSTMNVALAETLATRSTTSKVKPFGFDLDSDAASAVDKINAAIGGGAVSYVAADGSHMVLICLPKSAESLRMHWDTDRRGIETDPKSEIGSQSVALFNLRTRVNDAINAGLSTRKGKVFLWLYPADDKGELPFLIASARYLHESTSEGGAYIMHGDGELKIARAEIQTALNAPPEPVTVATEAPTTDGSDVTELDGSDVEEVTDGSDVTTEVNATDAAPSVDASINLVKSTDKVNNRRQSASA